MEGLGVIFNNTEGQPNYGPLTRFIDNKKKTEGIAIFATNSKLALTTIDNVLFVKGEWPTRWTLLVFDNMSNYNNYIQKHKVNIKQIQQPEEEIAMKAVQILVSLIKKEHFILPIPLLHTNYV